RPSRPEGTYHALLSAAFIARSLLFREHGSPLPAVPVADTSAAHRRHTAERGAPHRDRAAQAEVGASGPKAQVGSLEPRSPDEPLIEHSFTNAVELPISNRV